MIYITFDNGGSKVSVTPMPSSGGLFSDATVPNCPTESACLVRAAQALRSLGVDIQVPRLTAAERTTASAAQIADKANWSDEEKAMNVVTTDEIATRRDSIRGYTEAHVLKYIEDNSVEGEDPISDEVARTALHMKDQLTGLPVVVPSDENISLTILDEKESAMASSKIDALIASGHLVTDLSIDAYTAWKSQFTVTEIA